MVDRTVRGCGFSKLACNTIVNHLVGLWIVDLMPCPFCAAVQAEEGDSGAEASEYASRVLRNVRSWPVANDVAGVLLFILKHICILCLCWIDADTAAVVGHCLWGIGGVGRNGRREVVLEKEVVFVGYTADAAEDVAFHEVFDIAAKAVDDLGQFSIVK